jgi:hypothetical protein
MRGAWIGLFFLASCAPSSETTFTADPTDIVIASINDASGAVEGAFRISPGSAIPAAVPSGGSVSFFRIPAADLIGEDGAPLSTAMLEGLTVRLAGRSPAPAGSCRRCLNLDDSTPMIAHAGSSCPPPLRSGLEVDGKTPTEAQRLAIRLDWPGPCSCELSLGRETFELDVEQLHGAAERDPTKLEPYLATAVTKSGEIAVFGPTRGLVLDPRGRVIPGTEKTYDELRPVLFSVALASGRFLVAEYPPKAEDFTAVSARVFDPMLAYAPAAISFDEYFKTQRALARDSGEGFVLFGGSVGSIPAVRACDPAASGWLCRELANTATDLPTNVYEDGVILDRGTLVAVGSGGDYFYASSVPRAIDLASPGRGGRSSTPDGIALAYDGTTEIIGGGTVRWRTSFASRIDTPWGAFRPAFQKTIGHLGNRVFACSAGLRPDDSFASVVVTKEIEADFFDRPGANDAREWTPVLCMYEECGGFVEDTATSTVIELFTKGGKRVRFDRAGNLLDGGPPAPCTGISAGPVIPARLRRVHPKTSDRAFVETHDLSIYARTATSPFRPMFGPAIGGAPLPSGAAHDGRRIGGIVPAGDRFFGFGSYGLVVSVEPDRSWRDLVRSETIEVWDRGVVMAAAIDRTHGRDGTRVMLFGVTEAKGWALPVVVEGRTLRSDGRAIELPAIPVDASEVAPGVFVIAVQVRDPRGAGSLLRLRRGEITAIEIDDVDPITGRQVTFDLMERFPSCPPRQVPSFYPWGYAPNEGGLRAVDGAQGIAWAVGCGRVVLRVNVLSEPPRAVVRDPNRAPPSLTERLDRPDFDGVRALCADHAVFSSDSPNSSFVVNNGVFLRIEPRSSDRVIAKASDLEPEITDIPVSGGDGSYELEVGSVIELLADGTSVIAVYRGADPDRIGGALEVVGGSRRNRMLLELDAAAMNARGEIVFASDGWRLFRAARR